MLIRCVVLLVSVSLAGCGAEKQQDRAAQSSQPSQRAVAPPDTSPEHLLAEPPAGWIQTFRTEGPGIRMVEYVPPASNENDWTEKLSFESFSDPPLPDAIEMLKSIALDQGKTCQKFSDHETFSGVENDYPTSVRLFVCYKNPLINKGQLTLVKTIRGDDHFYVITRAQRVAPIEPNGEMPMPPATMAAWSLYLRAISVCNANDDRHPCPPAKPEPAADSE
jgi:hypothetical protein